MTTGEFIKMLQEADPSGNAHIRMEGGVPFAAEGKPGYWDGPYSYMKDGKYITTSQGSKVDIHMIDMEQMVWDKINIHDQNSFEKINGLFVFDFGNFSFPSQREEKEKCYRNSIKKYYDEAYEFEKQMFDESTAKALDRAKQGWRFFQDKKIDEKDPAIEKYPKHYTYYRWIVEEPNKPSTSSSKNDTEGVLYSGAFEKLDNNEREGFYEWKLKTT